MFKYKKTQANPVHAKPDAQIRLLRTDRVRIGRVMCILGDDNVTVISRTTFKYIIHRKLTEVENNIKQLIFILRWGAGQYF
jgi:hypothetical protein